MRAVIAEGMRAINEEPDTDFDLLWGWFNPDGHTTLGEAQCREYCALEASRISPP